MKTLLLALLTASLTLPAFAQVPPTRVMKCDKFLFVTIRCYYVKKPKPVVKKPATKIDVRKPGNYRSMSEAERALIDAR